jgi:hypothetical protein
MFDLIDSCMIDDVEVVDQRLHFDTGTSEFTIGKTVTGSVSHAYGIIKNLVKESGDWTLGTAVGYLVISLVIGTFVNDEILIDDGTAPGSATAFKTVENNVDDYNVPTTTISTTTTPCRFASPRGGMQRYESGDHVSSLPMVILPATVSVSEGKKLVTTTPGFAGTYTIRSIKSRRSNTGTHHITCDIEKVM